MTKYHWARYKKTKIDFSVWWAHLQYATWFWEAAMKKKAKLWQTWELWLRKLKQFLSTYFDFRTTKEGKYKHYVSRKKTPTCSGGRKEIVGLLLEYKGDVNSLTRDGQSPFFSYLQCRSNLKDAALLNKLLSSYPLKLKHTPGHPPTGLLFSEIHTLKEYYHRNYSLCKIPAKSPLEEYMVKTGSKPGLQ